MKKNVKPFDFGLFIIIMLLLVIGSIMILSASGPSALSETGNSYHYFFKQIGCAGLGVMAMFGLSAIDYRIWKKFGTLALIISIILLTLVLLIGVEQNGAKRWLNVGTQFQPSEFVKIALIIFLADRISKDGKKINNLKTLIINYGIPIIAITLLLFLEPHKSAIFIIGGTALFIMLMGGLEKKWLLLVGIGGVAAFTYMVFKDDYSTARVLSFLNPWQDPLGDGYQVIQSLYAIGSGGLFGKGLGNSIQKHGYIPEPHNDFIFAIVIEELGFIAAIGILILFIILIWKGIQIATRASDTFGSLVAGGITTLVAVQVICNIAVVTSSMPVTGIPLPFFSYGGTSIIFLLASMGLLLSISRHTN